ncbi:duboraya isoform X2 [Alosa alosa]|uniref:duboraya isoform X2 n=1 Tax=Alosa alosa TaxID=278164 RepID=UPI0020154107|nr:duboraya isoform X2 [Alosa alosa]
MSVMCDPLVLHGLVVRCAGLYFSLRSGKCNGTFHLYITLSLSAGQPSTCVKPSPGNQVSVSTLQGNPVIKVSVAELAGKFKDHSVSSCAGYDGNKPVRRRPPRTLQIPATGDESQAEEQKSDGAAARPARSRNRNSALIEKLQSNLALSPLALSPTPMLPSPKSPGLRLQPPGSSPNCPSSPVAPMPRAGKKPVEAPASFESPADAALLPSINKGRARLSVRRRPPSRRVRRAGEEEMDGEGGGSGTSSPVEPADGESEATHPTDALTAEKHTDDRGVPDPETKAASVKEAEVVDEVKAQVKPPIEVKAQVKPPIEVKAQVKPPIEGKAEVKPPIEGKAEVKPTDQFKLVNEASSAAAAEADRAVETSTAEREAAEKDTPEPEKQDGPSETSADQQEADTVKQEV